MKKSLSAIVSLAMAFSMFSSVAFAATKTSADFSDLKDLDAATKAKFDALISAGIFDGVSEGTFGLKDKMNRAQFAKVAALIFDLEVNKDLKTSSFSDVKAEDPANGYALPYIEAVKAAGITDGYAPGEFNPAGEVTKEQLATFLVRGLGKEADAKGKAGNDSTVSGWAQGYVALALELKLLSNGADGKFGGTSAATRSELALSSYEADKVYVPSGEVGVTSAKATGAKTVEVQFSKPVDTAKASLKLKKGTVDVVASVKFADDKKSAVLTLTDTKLSAGTYTLTVGSVAAQDIVKEIVAEDEKVAKIEFVSANDTIAKAKNVAVLIKATNQYGENASFSAGSYSTYGEKVTKLSKNNDGFLVATVDSSAEAAGTGVVTISIVSSEGGQVSATKIFKVGTEPILSKMELGTPKYSNGTAISGSGDNVKYSLNLYDQYGSLLGYDSLNIGNAATEKKTTVIWNDYLDGASYVVEDDGNNNPILKISLTKNVDKQGDYNFTVINQASSATGKVSINSNKVATKIKIGALNNVIAAGDEDAYIPVEAYDAQGNLLTPEDLISTENLNRIKVTVSGGTNPNGDKLEQTGENKGKIKVTAISGSKNNVVSVNAIIATANVSSSDTKNFTIQAARTPDSIKQVTAPGAELVAGGSTKFKYQILDQYGQVLKKLQMVDSQGNAGSGATYTVSVTATTYNTATTPATPISVTAGDLLSATKPLLATVDKDAVDADPTKTPQTDSVAAFGDTPVTYASSLAALNDNTFRFAASNNAAAVVDKKIELKIVIFKGTTEIQKLTKTVTVTKAGTTNNGDLTYSLNSVATLWNAADKDNTVVTDATYKVPNSKFGREITVAAKNAAGELVGLPKKIVGVSSSDTGVAQVLQLTDANGLGKAYVIGNKPGTATVQVSFIAVDGSTKTLKTDVTVKADALKVDKVTFDETAWNEVANFNAFTGLNVTDNYGVTYEDGTAKTYNFALGVGFAVSNIKSLDANAKVVIDKDGNVAITSLQPVAFDLTANTAIGKSATTTIYYDAANTTRTKR